MKESVLKDAIEECDDGIEYHRGQMELEKFKKAALERRLKSLNT